MWRWVGPDLRGAGFAGIDFLLAASFFAMARGRLFPAPLFLLHGALAACGLYTAAAATPAPSIVFLLNRGFELALLYVCGCAAYRAARLRAGARDSSA